ncbi:MAG: N-acetyl-gamma-glutamyl-phosphate reductase [Candidatus Pelagibacter sp.]
MSKVNVLIAGSTGYIGIQLIKLLINHRKVKIKYLCGNSSVGKKINYFDKNIKVKYLPKIIKYHKKLLNDVDVIFTALPNGEAQKISNHLLKKNILIDLSADFRLKNYKDYKKCYKIKHSSIKNIKNSIYALPEVNRDDIKNYKIISCPGCYPTSVLIPLIPLIKKNLIKQNNIIIDSKSGYSGAGRQIHRIKKKENLYDSLSSYGIRYHRHNSEIQQELNSHTKKNIEFTFTPHLSPMFRGILSTIYVDVNKNINFRNVYEYLKKYYQSEQFIRVLSPDKMISTNDVINTNLCKLSICKSKEKNKIIILSAIDNLIKGGSGQALQNFNIKFNFNEKLGLI